MNRRHFLALAAGALTATPLTSFSFSRARGNAGMEADDASTFHATRRHAHTAFGDIAYTDRGTGAAALFLHGFPLNSFQWRGAIERLAPYRRCIAPDFLGLGYTQVADSQDVGPDAQVAMLAALLDTLKIDSVDLIANDSGGAIAQLFAVRHRTRVRTLLLTNCDVEANSPPAAMLPVLALAKEERWVDEWLGRWHADKALARSPEGIGGMCFSDPSQPTDAAIDTYFAPLLASPRHKALANAYAVALERNPLAGITAQLERCTVPMRIVWGMADTIFAPADAEYLDRTLPISFGVRRLENGRLFWPEEHPDVIAEEARGLWARAASTPGDVLPTSGNA
jgi:pimeloyl-ACP methyl ester carboxylesterase